jgi:hypothetical protein
MVVWEGEVRYVFREVGLRCNLTEAEDESLEKGSQVLVEGELRGDAGRLAIFFRQASLRTSSAFQSLGT